MPGRKKTIMPLLPYRVIPFYVALIICPNRVQDAKCGEHRISEEALSPRFRHVLLLGSTVPDNMSKHMMRELTCAAGVPYRKQMPPPALDH